MLRNIPQQFVPQDVRKAATKRHWIPAQPGYYGGVIVGFMFMLFIDSLFVWGTLSLMLLLLPIANQDPSTLIRLLCWGGLFLLGVLLVFEAVVAWISFTSARDRLFVTQDEMDRMLAMHRAWYDACVQADPTLKNPKLWPTRPY